MNPAARETVLRRLPAPVQATKAHVPGTRYVVEHVHTPSRRSRSYFDDMRDARDYLCRLVQLGWSGVNLNTASPDVRSRADAVKLDALAAKRDIPLSLPDGTHVVLRTAEPVSVPSILHGRRSTH